VLAVIRQKVKMTRTESSHVIQKRARYCELLLYVQYDAAGTSGNNHGVRMVDEVRC
jgi:hypothetical protein